MKQLAIPALFGLLFYQASFGQTLIDSIPYPGISQGFWGIWVNPDTVFLGADIPGDVFFSDHEGNILGQQSTGFTFNHGLIVTDHSFLIAQDYTTNGAHLYEVDRQGNLLNTWQFPDVLGGHSSGIGDICQDGDAIWYTMYYPDFNVYPFSYAYKWIPGATTPIDTVPLRGKQPYGIAIKGDTLFYVTDDLQGDDERIYLYDLSTREELGFVDLPDDDNDQSPRGLYCSGDLLYLVGNRVGGSAWAYQTVYIFSLADPMVGIQALPDPQPRIHPSPANDHVYIGLPSQVPARGCKLDIFDPAGNRIVHREILNAQERLNTSSWEAGVYLIRITGKDQPVITGKLVVQH